LPQFGQFVASDETWFPQSGQVFSAIIILLRFF
jgi:hypothetical protein